jgi:long-chain acyl-CoA synthetase
MNTKDILIKTANQYPEREILVFQDKRIKAREYLNRVFRVSNALLGLGLKKGDRVAVLLSNSHHSVECFHGNSCAGLVLVPLNSRNSPREHLYMLNNSEASAIILGKEFAETVSSILPEASTVSHAICIGDTPHSSMLDYDDLLAKSSPTDPQIGIADDDMSAIRYTSGTTGHPKGVHRDHRSDITAVYNCLIDGLEIRGTDAVALTGPVTHASGSLILPHFVRGAKVVILPGFNARKLIETIEKERITTLYLVPTMIVMLLAEPGIENYDLSSLRTIRYGASPIAPEVLKRAIDLFGNVFVQGYGLTEGSMPLTLLIKEDHIMDGSEKKLKRLSSVGREVTLTKVRIMDVEGNILPPGEIGEIVAQSDQIMKGYWKNPEATTETLRSGWLHTRDMGYMDEDGYLFLVDRKDDMIISGGFNIYPREVEDVIYMHPAVLEAAVFGIPDEKWGETVKAVISLRKGMTATEEEIIEHCKANLASYKKPTSVDFIDDIPKNPNGKILKKVLKEPYWSGKERKIN